MENDAWKNQANLIKVARIKKGFSQSELSEKLGYKNGQFVSNIERQKCGLPSKDLAKICKILDIESEKLKKAIVGDFRNKVITYFQ